jgi:hypothetical protein
LQIKIINKKLVWKLKMPKARKKSFTASSGIPPLPGLPLYFFEAICKKFLNLQALNSK